MTLEQQHLVLALIIANYLWIRPWATGLVWDRDVIITLVIVITLVIIGQAYNAFK